MAEFSPETIREHLRQYVPQLTDLFSEQPAVTASIIAGDPQTLRITESSHGRSSGDPILLIDVVIANGITAVEEFTEPNGTRGLRFTTEADHDLTAGTRSPSTATLAGFTDSALNGTFTVYGVASATVFEIETAAAVPTLTGSEELREQWSYGPSGYRVIDSIVDADTYDVSLAGFPTFPTGALTSIKVATSWRIDIAQDINRAAEMYTKQPSGDEWLYIIPEDSTTSKDRNVRSDAIGTNTEQNDQRLLIINSFAVVAMFGTTGQLTAEEAMEKAWTEVLTTLWQALYGVKFDAPGDRQYAVVPAEHGSTQYNGAYYAHAYDFQFSYEISFEQGFTARFSRSRAYRENDIDISQ